MTPRKDTFILRADLYEMIEDWPSEKKGLLFDAILQYANGIEPNDTAYPADVTMTFRFVRRELDRNAEKYNDICAKRSDAGRRSAASRKSKCQEESAVETSEEYLKPLIPCTTLSTNVAAEEKEATVSAKSTNVTSVSFVQQPSTLSADNEYDCDNETESDDDFDDDDYFEIIDQYHEHCPSLPRLAGGITPKLRERLGELRRKFNLEEIKEVFLRAEKSDLLRGQVYSDFCGTLEWIINPEHFVKIQNGYYDSRKPQNLFNCFPQNHYDFEKLEAELLSS